MRETAQAAREAAGNYRTTRTQTRGAEDVYGLASEGKSLDDQLSDARLEAGAGWFRSNSSVQREVTSQRYAREIRTRFPGQDDATYDKLTGDASELARLREVNRETASVRDSFVQLGTAAGGALEQII